jgi:hypothetical protein
MRSMAKSKIDAVTHNFMENIDLYIPKESGTGKEARGDRDRDKINRKAISPDYRLGIFGNNIKIGRSYRAKFDNVGIETDIPRAFIMA